MNLKRILPLNCGLLLWLCIMGLFGCADGYDQPTSEGLQKLNPNPPPDPSPTSTSVSARAVFTAPHTGDSQSIGQEIEHLILNAQSGSKIKIALFDWERDSPLGSRIAEALRVAQARNVIVSIISDRLVCEDCGEITECGGACVGPANTDSGKNHNKFFLFSHVVDDAGEHVKVVVQSSENLVNKEKFNNAVIIEGDQELYRAYNEYFIKMRARDRDPNYYASNPGPTDHKHRLYRFPYSGASEPIKTDILQDVRCTEGSPVRVAMAMFTPKRIEIAQALGELARDGCDVKVIVGYYPKVGTDSSLSLEDRQHEFFRNAEQLRAAITAYSSESDFRIIKGDDDGDLNLHSKYMLIHAPYKSGDSADRLVFTGSHNYTGGALRKNDETLLLIKDNVAVYDAFMEDWRQLWTRARSIEETESLVLGGGPNIIEPDMDLFSPDMGVAPSDMGAPLDMSPPPMNSPPNCDSLEGTFNHGGHTYFANDSDHYCRLAHASCNEGLPNINVIPSCMVYDGDCGSYNPTACEAPSPMASCGVIYAEHTFVRGQQFSPCDRDNFYLVHQPDGNLVMYERTSAGDIARWHPLTRYTQNTTVVFQTDGNLVAYEDSARSGVIWNSQTSSYPGSTLQIHSDGNLVIYNAQGVPVWDTLGAVP